MATKKQNAISKQDKRLKEDIAAFKASVAFLLFCAVIFFTVNNLQYVRGSYHVPIRVFMEKNPWVALISVLLLAGAVALRYMKVKAGKDEAFSYFSSEDALTIALFQFLFIATFLLTNMTSVLICVVVAFAAVYYVRHFFGKDFLLVTLLNCDIAMALWLIFGSTGETGLLATISKVLFVAATAIGFFASIYALVKLYLNKSLVKSEKLSVLPSVISVVTGGVLGVLLLIPGSIVTLLVAEIILLAQFIGLGIYYTVKLLNQ